MENYELRITSRSDRLSAHLPRYPGQEISVSRENTILPRAHKRRSSSMPRDYDQVWYAQAKLLWSSYPVSDLIK